VGIEEFLCEGRNSFFCAYFWESLPFVLSAQQNISEVANIRRTKQAASLTPAGDLLGSAVRKGFLTVLKGADEDICRPQSKPSES
jgi:hypothetical protein